MRRHRLGQHYLTDDQVVRDMVEAAGIRPHERILEIGTGRGALTRKLAGLGSSFEGYEVDVGNYEETQASVRGANAVICLGDAFERTPAFDVLVSSLPYSRSAAFIEWLSGAEFDRAVVLLQEDFVRKILASPGTRDYRAISALAQISSEIKAVRRVGRGSFRPQPRVNSLIVMIKPRRRMSGSEVHNVKRLFSLRRRQVASALAKLGIPASKRGYGGRRVYSLTPPEVHEICSTPRSE